MRYLPQSSTDPYFNMAFDEYCLEKLSVDEPVFYLWQNRPSVIMGAHQEVNTEVNLAYLKEKGIALARRVTGGGAVYHDFGNLNYTIVGRSADLERDYPEYTHYMLHALQTLGVPAELSGRNDIMVEGRKVSGFAKRVCGERLMVHGTLMFDVDLETLAQALRPSSDKLRSKGIASVRSRVANLKEYLPHIPDIDTLKQRLEVSLSKDYADKEYTLQEKDIESIRRLADEKFSRWEWIYGRSPGATLRHSARFACGTIEVGLTLSENRIASCAFGGDFLGNLPTASLEEALKGTPYTAADIREKLSFLPVNAYFDGLSADELCGLLL